MKKIKRGVNLPINGSPSNEVTEKNTRFQGFNASDFNGMKPSFKVKEGDIVSKGDILFTWKQDAKVAFTSPASGVVKKIQRGARRALQVVEIEANGQGAVKTFEHYKGPRLSEYSKEDIINLLAESGQWLSFRTRPFSKTPLTDSAPAAIFVNAMDTNPLALDPEVFIQQFQASFNDGLDVIQRLTEGKVYISAKVGHRFITNEADNREIHEFSGPHPSGNTGTHIHLLEPVSANKTVWTIGYQDVVAIGKLFGSGELFTERWISLCGPAAKKPRIVRTTTGASLEELISGEENIQDFRAVSGSVIFGQSKSDTYKFLGKFSTQVTLLEEERERVFLGWHDAGLDRFSVMRTFVSKLMPGKKFNFGTSTHGSYRAMVPVGAYEKVFPFDMIPTHLLKALYVGDTDYAQQLGCLELDEEDLALCTYVDPGKVDYGPKLRKSLEKIEKEG